MTEPSSVAVRPAANSPARAGCICAFPSRCDDATAHATIAGAGRSCNAHCGRRAWYGEGAGRWVHRFRGGAASRGRRTPPSGSTPAGTTSTSTTSNRTSPRWSPRSSGRVPPLPTDASAVDIGCGVGTLASRFHAAYPELRLTLLDTDEENIETAQRKMGKGGTPAVPLRTALTRTRRRTAPRRAVCPRRLLHDLRRHRR